MGEAKLGVFIQAVELLPSLKRPLLSIVDRLSAAAYAASRTGHNFYKIVVYILSLIHI